MVIKNNKTKQKKTYSERIIQYLETVSKATTTNIRDNTLIHYSFLKVILEDLETKGKIFRSTNDSQTFTYWGLKK